MENFQNEIAELKKRIDNLERNQPKDKLSMIVFSGSLDKILAALIVATGASAMGTEVSMFFTFWGTTALRKKAKVKKNFISKIFGAMLPTGSKDLKLSQMNLGGMGTAMMKKLMKKKNITSVEDLLEIAEESEIKIFICEMSMNLMGMSPNEMIEYEHLEYSGVVKFLAEADESKNILFI